MVVYNSANKWLQCRHFFTCLNYCKLEYRWNTAHLTLSNNQSINIKASIPVGMIFSFKGVYVSALSVIIWSSIFDEPWNIYKNYNLFRHTKLRIFYLLGLFFIEIIYSLMRQETDHFANDMVKLRTPRRIIRDSILDIQDSICEVRDSRFEIEDPDEPMGWKHLYICYIEAR